MAIQMTRAEYEAKYGQPPQSPVSAIKKAPIKMTRAEYEAKYGSTPQQSDIQKQKQDRIAKGLPVSVREDRAEPTMAGSMVRDVLKYPMKFAASVGGLFSTKEKEADITSGKAFGSDYLGDVQPVGFSKDEAGNVVEPTIGSSVGAGLEGASYLPIARGASTAFKGAQLGFKEGAKQLFKQGAKTAAEGAVGGAMQGSGSSLQQGDTSGEVIKSGVTGALAGGATGGLFGIAGPLAGSFAKKAINLPKNVNYYMSPEGQAAQIDEKVRSLFKDTTADVNQINNMAYKSKKGLELLTNLSDNIEIPDEKAPLGTNLRKKFNIETATPNEFISALNEVDNKITSAARMAVEDARNKGIKVDVSGAKSAIKNAINSGDITEATGARMLRQIENIGDDPVKAHDWVQDVNTRYKKKYERGTIEDTSIGKIADDVAEIMRRNLDDIVDRRGYAEAYGNNQELKRLLIAIAKKANKGVNFGDISGEAGLDAGFALLTGNPAYMARTIGSSAFRGVVNSIKNKQGFRNLKGATKKMGGLSNETRLPYSFAKPQPSKTLQLPAGSGQFVNNAPVEPTVINLPKETYTSAVKRERRNMGIQRSIDLRQKELPIGLPEPSGKAGVIELPEKGTFAKNKATKSGFIELLNARIKNPNDRRRLIRIIKDSELN